MRTDVKLTRTPVVEIGYLESGPPDGEPIVFLHGFPDDAGGWEGVVAHLADRPVRLLRPFQRGYGPSRVLVPEARTGQVAALAQDVLDFADALGLRRFVLVGHDWGSRAGHAAAVLAGPSRITALVTLASPYGEGRSAASAEAKLAQAQAYWYQWYLHTSAGRAALERDRDAFCAHLWRVWSPTWDFSPEDFASAACAFRNEDFVETVVHYYRHRSGAASGVPCYEGQERRLRDRPPVPVPTTFVCGSDDGCVLPETSRGNKHLYAGDYRFVELPGVGHFPHRERSGKVAELILERL